MPTKPTIVIIPGAWLKPAKTWGKFISEAQIEGYRAECCVLPSIGSTQDPLPGMEDDVEAVVNTLSNIASTGKQGQILILCHSSGGIIASQVAQRAPEIPGIDILGIVYLAALVIPKGRTLLDAMPGGKKLEWIEQEKEDRISMRQEVMADICFNDISPQDQRKYMPENTHISFAIFTTPATFEPWAKSDEPGVKRIRCSYIFCNDDKALPLFVQEHMASNLGDYGITRNLDCGHYPQISMPTTLLAMVQSVYEQMSTEDDESDADED